MERVGDLTGDGLADVGVAGFLQRTATRLDVLNRNKQAACLRGGGVQAHRVSAKLGC
jgi:hypothetical protein